MEERYGWNRERGALSDAEVDCLPVRAWLQALMLSDTVCSIPVDHLAMDITKNARVEGNKQQPSADLLKWLGAQGGYSKKRKFYRMDYVSRIVECKLTETAPFSHTVALESAVYEYLMIHKWRKKTVFVR